LHDSGQVGLTPILKGRMGPVLERLDQAAAETDGHRGAGQPLRLALLQVVQQRLGLLGVQRRQLVGPFRAYDRNPPRPRPQRRRRVVEVEPPLLPAGGVVGKLQVDVL
jgi:hypothetical protein